MKTTYIKLLSNDTIFICPYSRYLQTTIYMWLNILCNLFLMGYKPWWEKEKILVTIFTFSLYVFKKSSYLGLTTQDCVVQ